ncbi:Transcription antitermination factor NusB [[Mycoplasma] cavipharyngis]|uniref:transcription antitermination factor NusB n=1 Tax=[Mycoplasma] cavipharyngis TaxID=92757 RepID=UPI0037039E0A
MSTDQPERLPFWKRRIFVIETIFSDLIFAIPLRGYKSRIINYDQWTDFEKSIFDYYLANKFQLIKQISAFLRSDWTINRLEQTTLSIILEAVAEYHVKNTPKNVLIQQAVITTQKYSSECEYKLVNAVLENYFKSL